MVSKLEAVESLMELGLTEYEARCFVALSQLSVGTAKEISRIADVPQSRVYDIADELHEMGVLDVQESEPRKYRAVPAERALQRLQREYDDALETAADRLSGLESRQTTDRGVWEIADQQEVLDRLVTHLGEAREEVYLLVADEDLLDGDLLGALEGAADRDVDVYIEVPSPAARETVREVIPQGHVAVTDFSIQSVDIPDRDPGRLALIDRDTVVISSIQEGLVPGECEETGLWGTGVGHGLVVWIQPMLEHRLERREFPTV